MNVSKSSWHFKFIKMSKVETPKTKCGYILTFVSLILLYSLLLFCAYGLTSLIGIAYSVNKFPDYTILFPYISYSLIGLVFLIALLIGAVLIGLLILGVIILSVVLTPKLIKTKPFEKVKNIYFKYCQSINYRD